MIKLMALILGAMFQRFPSPTCSGGCVEDLAPVNFDDCAPQVAFSEIVHIILGKKFSADFTDWTTGTEWTARLSATSNNPNALRMLTVIGDKPAATPIDKEISNGRRFVIGKDHTINFTIDDVSDENYEFMRQLECGTEVKFWYETAGENMFGGNSGEIGRIVANSVLGRGRDEIEVITGTISWRSKFHPERTTSPIFGISNTTNSVLDTTLRFATSTIDADAGVSGVVSATDADLKFEFNEVTPRVGTPATMTLTIGGTSVLVVDYPTDYNGKAFKFTSAAGTVYNNTFAAGTKAL